MGWETILGAAGTAASGAAQIGGLMANIFGDSPEVPVPQGYKSWVENIPDMSAMTHGLMPMPYLTGISYPSFGGAYREKPGYGFGDISQVYPATQEFYKSALGGRYGYSDEELEGQRQRLLASRGLGGLGQAYTPRQFAQSSYIDPQSLAESMAGYDEIALRDQQSYLQNAGMLASYNARRARMLGSLLGSA